MGGPGSGRSGGGGSNHASGASGGARGNSRDSGNHHNYGSDTHGQSAKRGGVRKIKKNKGSGSGKHFPTR
jgi:hypothetical protein